MTRTVRRRFLVLFAAIAALIALSGGLAVPTTAQAQSAGVLVSNIGLTPSGSTFSFIFKEFAKGIYTGSNTGGYSLTSVELDVSTVPNSTTDLVVQIWSSTADNVPDSAVITLENPTTLSVGLNTFSAPESSVLNASTSYFLVVSYTGDSPYLGMERNSTGALDDTGLAGWDWGERVRSRPRIKRCLGARQHWAAHAYAFQRHRGGGRHAVHPDVERRACLGERGRHNELPGHAGRKRSRTT